MTFHDNDVSKHAMTDGTDASLHQPSTGGIDVTRLQANSTEYAALKGNQTIDSKILPNVAFFDSQTSGEHGSAPMLMARADQGDGHSVFGKLGDKAKELGSKAGDVAKKAGEKTGDLAKKGTGNDAPYSEKNLETAAEKALKAHTPAERKAIHDTLSKMSEADKHKLYTDLEKYNTETKLATTGTKFGGIIGGGPLGGVIGSKASGEVGKVIPEPESVKSFHKKVNEKLHH